jgi:ADP-heptose:LPS heptosyltransferase
MSKKILILKNDRVGDLFHSLDGINAILNDNKDANIEIILSNVSKDLSFLFQGANIKISYLPYSLTILNKFRLFLKMIFNSFDQVYILCPKNFYYYLVLFSNSKFFAITIKNSNKSRPFNFLKKKLFKYIVNDRDNKRINHSINSLIFKLCSDKSRLDYSSLINKTPETSDLFKNNIPLFSNFIHVHYKDTIFRNNGWTLKNFFDLVGSLPNTNKIIITSDYGDFDYHKDFLSNFSNLNFDNLTNKIDFKKKIHYLHNLGTEDLFELIKLSSTVISPHGAMTVMASYLNKKVIDIFDTNINLNAFREYKPNNDNYNFLIINKNFIKFLFKIKNFL